MTSGVVKVAPVVIATLDQRPSFSQPNMDPVLSNPAKAFHPIAVDTSRVARPPKTATLDKFRLTSPAYICEVQDVDEARRLNGHVTDGSAWRCKIGASSLHIYIEPL
jgi:hypothetical protein